MESLNSSKDYFSIGYHLSSLYFLLIFYEGLTISTKSVANLQTKYILLKKDYMDFLLLGMGICMTILILSWSTNTPYSDLMCPSKFSFQIVKMIFFGSRETPYFWHLSKVYFRFCILFDLLLEYTMTLSR